MFSRQASKMELLLFDAADATHPARVVELDPDTQRTYHYWHAFVPGIGSGQLYAYRTLGPFDPGQEVCVLIRARRCSIPTAARLPSQMDILGSTRAATVKPAQAP